MIPISAAVERYLERKSVGDPDGPGSGTYASNAESILGRWARWLADEHEITSLSDLDIGVLEAYARELTLRTNRGEYTASTARTYFAVVRAFLTWCADEEMLEVNPADTTRATSALPTAEPRARSQYWSNDDRRTLERHVMRRANDADVDGDDRLARLREYAMVTVLAHAGVRGSELFRVPEDDRRTGATWDDVDFYTGTIRVLGKSQRLEEVALPAPARTPLRRYRIVLDPPSQEWPLFPTRHAPSIARRVRVVLADRGLDEDEIGDLMANSTAIELARDRSIPPPAITTEGARSILRRLCAEADVDIDGDYLKPQGARHGVGDEAQRNDATVGGDLRAALEQSLVVSDVETDSDSAS